MILNILIPNLIPLYGLILLGYISGRWLDVNLHSVARLNLFIFLPIVTMGAMVKMDFNPAYIVLPFVMMGISYTIALGSYNIAKMYWKDGTANLIGAGGVNGNALYFGLPLIIAMFGPAGAGIYVLMNVGPQINNNTLAYYLVARGQFTVKESLKKLMWFPVIHALWIGLALNFAGVEMGGIYTTYWEYAIGCNIFSGMMMIGIAIGKLPKLTFDWAMIGTMFVVKFVLWPLFVGVFVMVDLYVLRIFDHQIYQIMLLFSLMPLIGNLVAFAAEHRLYPEKAAAAVLASSIATLVIIPCAYLLMIWAGIAG